MQKFFKLHNYIYICIHTKLNKIAFHLSSSWIIKVIFNAFLYYSVFKISVLKYNYKYINNNFLVIIFILFNKKNFIFCNINIFILYNRFINRFFCILRIEFCLLIFQFHELKLFPYFYIITNKNNIQFE